MHVDIVGVKIGWHCAYYGGGGEVRYLLMRYMYAVFGLNTVGDGDDKDCDDDGEEAVSKALATGEKHWSDLETT